MIKLFSLKSTHLRVQHRLSIWWQYVLLISVTMWLTACSSNFSNHMGTLRITPDVASLPIGLTLPLTVKANFTDGSSPDLTSIQSLQWLSSDESIAKVDNQGKLTTIKAGNTTISVKTISKDGVQLQATSNIKVKDINIVSLEISPESSVVPANMERQFMATAWFDDGTSLNVSDHDGLRWQSNDNDIAVVSNSPYNKGLTKALKAGDVDITAKLSIFGDEYFSDVAQLNITSASITGVEVTPDISSIPVGRSRQLTAFAIFSDNSKEDVTECKYIHWSSSHPDVAIVNDSGQVQRNKKGPVEIKAELFQDAKQADHKSFSPERIGSEQRIKLNQTDVISSLGYK